LKRPLSIIIVVLILDQALKVWIKTNMYLGQEFQVIGDWFIIHFTENNGMAFGLELAGQWGKLFLTLFRILAVGLIIWVLHRLISIGANKGYISSISLILAGAIGNIIDSVFYGVIFNESTFQKATLFPDGGGYSGLFYGKVVDMFYFPLIHGHFPNWFPVWGGEDFIFFRPVFNIADSAITIGIFLIILFYRKHFDMELKKDPDPVVEGIKEE